jgi:hypothetical protein
MAKPQLDTVCFAKLSSNPNVDNHGTVTGAHINTDDKVTIESKTTTKVWVGAVTTKVAGNTWNAVVRRVRNEERGTETVGVTVTNGEGDSNEVIHKPEVVP